MDCVNCDARADYNRVAVDRPTGEVTGAICVQCGEDIVSRSESAPALTMATCLSCGDASDILFPKWDAIVETDGGPDTIEYTVELTTPALCEGCLAAERPSSQVGPPEGVKTD